MTEYCIIEADVLETLLYCADPKDDDDYCAEQRAWQVFNKHTLEGWLLVPNEPTQDMVNAALNPQTCSMAEVAKYAKDKPMHIRKMRRILEYQAMVQAAPKHPSMQGENDQ